MAVAIAFALVVGVSAGGASCNVDEEELCRPDYCDEEGGGIPYICKPITGFPKIACSLSEAEALAWCQGMGGRIRVPACYDWAGTGETGDESADETGPSGNAWEPGAHIVFVPRANTYYVDRVLVDDVLADASVLANDSARLAPTPSGHYELQRVAVGDLADAMGLRSGDVLIDVNGYELGTLDGQMTAYTELLEEASFVLTVERDGRLMTKTYEIVG